MELFKDSVVTCIKNILKVLNDHFNDSYPAEKAYYFIIENLKVLHLDTEKNFEALERQIKTLLGML